MGAWVAKFKAAGGFASLLLFGFKLMLVLRNALTQRRVKQLMANKDFGEWLEVVVETAKAYRAAKADGKISMADTILIVPVMMKLPAAIEGSNVAFKDLKVEDLQAAALAILEGLGQSDDKWSVYVKEAFAIVGHGVEIVEAVKRIKAA